MNFLKKILFFAFFSFSSAAFADEYERIKMGTDLSLTVSSRPEAKVALSQSFVFPFLQGQSPLVADNNVTAVLRTELSPISVNEVAEITWTPIAFFQLVTGGRIGSGWNINLFSEDIYGIGIVRKSGGSVVVDGNGFDGLLWSVKTGAAVQFDFAAIFPGDWNHVVFRTYHEINYAGYSAARSSEPWYFENDDGENMNGWNYYGNYLLGYQMPLFLNMVGLLAETSNYLYTTENREIWGDELPRWNFSILFNFTVTERVSIAALAQLWTRRTFTQETENNAFYQDRVVESEPIHLEFYRVAAIVTFKLR
ncbi:MAG: hypothetical protein LBG05_11005 [Treponema sp.]|jgi:hypothetical protein|nr:hypothetical protein [Treponema sp.]